MHSVKRERYTAPLDPDVDIEVSRQEAELSHAEATTEARLQREAEARLAAMDDDCEWPGIEE